MCRTLHQWICEESEISITRSGVITRSSVLQRDTRIRVGEHVGGWLQLGDGAPEAAPSSQAQMLSMTH